MPLARDTLQHMKSSVRKGEPGARDEISHRARDEDLDGLCGRGDTGRDVDGYSHNVVASNLALSRVQARAEREALGR